MFRSPFTWLALLAVAVIATPLIWVTKPAQVTTPAQAATSTTGARPSPTPEPSGLTNVSPERLRLSGSSVAPQTLDVSYAIPQPQQVNKAWLDLYVGTIGTIARMDLAVQAAGSVRFEVVPSFHNVGPHVQFRANCPQGATGWHSMGSPVPTWDARQADVFQISHVSPNSLGWNQRLAESRNDRFSVALYGKQFTADCTIEATVDGFPIELHLVRYRGRSFEVMLDYEDIFYHAIATRYAELRLGVERAGRKGLVSVVTLPFD